MAPFFLVDPCPGAAVVATGVAGVVRGASLGVAWVIRIVSAISLVCANLAEVLFSV